MEFWGPVLERFVVLTFDPLGQFDSGHWVGTAEYSPAFTYTFRFDGRAIRGDWQDVVRGNGWSEVPTRPENPVIGFWGPLEGRVLSRFDANGPGRQTMDAVDVEDSHHRLLTIAIERVGAEEIEVPAGRFRTTHYRSERFGWTDHWVDERGTLVRWRSEGGTYRWDLEHYPSPDPAEANGAVIARGVYDVSVAGKPAGSVPWSIDATVPGDIRVTAREQLEERTSRFDGSLDRDWRWKGSSETVHWVSGEGGGPPEIHHLEMFFFRDRVHLLRFRDRAYPLLQSRSVASPAPFYNVDYPVTAVAWLGDVPRLVGKEQPLPRLAHIANRYRGGGIEVQDAVITYIGPFAPSTPGAEGPGHQFVLRYPGGWEDSRIELWTDARFIPQRVRMGGAERDVEYRLRDYQVSDRGKLRSK